MYNLKTVVKFEILKQLRKPLFWIAVFAFPAIMLVFGGVAYLNAQMSKDNSQKAKDNVSHTAKKIAIVDHTKLLKNDAFTGMEASFYPNEEQALQAFKTKPELQGLIIYPAKIVDEPIKIYTKGDESDKAKTQQLSLGMQQIAKTALQNSVASSIDKTVAKILANKQLATSTAIMKPNGQTYDPTKNMIIPGVFLFVLFLVFSMTSNQVLVATTEEKENRIAEMILTTVQAKTLITGKIIALVILGFIQIISLLLPILIFYLVAVKYLSLPPFINSILSGVTFEFWPIFFGASIMIFGYLMLTGSTILIGSLFPTAQDAAQFFAPIIITIMLPFYLMNAITSGSSGVLISFMSFFPITAPTTLLIRNMAGTLSVSEGLLGLAIVVAFSVISMLLSVRAFRQGVFEYSKKGSFKQIIRELFN